VRTTFHEQLDALRARLSGLCRRTEAAPARAPQALLEAVARADGLEPEVLAQR
jgi:hypothetical protein